MHATSVSVFEEVSGFEKLVRKHEERQFHSRGEKRIESRQTFLKTTVLSLPTCILKLPDVPVIDWYSVQKDKNIQQRGFASGHPPNY